MKKKFDKAGAKMHWLFSFYYLFLKFTMFVLYINNRWNNINIYLLYI